MYCSQCRAEVAIDAKFCHKCGKPVELPSSPTTSKPPMETEHVSLESATPFPRLLAILWKLWFASVPICVGLLLFGLYFTQFLELWFHTLAPRYIGYFMLCNALGFRYYWRRFNRRGWVGVLVSIVVSLVFHFLGSLISGYMRGQ